MGGGTGTPIPSDASLLELFEKTETRPRTFRSKRQDHINIPIPYSSTVRISFVNKTRYTNQFR